MQAPGFQLGRMNPNPFSSFRAVGRRGLLSLQARIPAHRKTMTEELKPGQKFPTPTPGFGDRVFYETLLRQRPDSAMAQEW
jgi:hypothetical protein